MLDIKGWKIDVYSLLKGENREGWVSDNLFENEKTDTACLIYSITEVGMCWYMGFLAVFKNKNSPTLIFNTASFRISGNEDAVSFSLSGDLIFVKICLSSNKDKVNRLELPILILDIRENKYSYIPIINGSHYSLEEIDSTHYKLKDNHFDKRFKTQNGRIIDIKKLKSYDLSMIDELPKMYFAKNNEGFLQKIFSFYKK